MQATAGTFHPSSGWMPSNHALTMSPSSWSDPESRQESPGSIKTMKTTPPSLPYEPKLVKAQQQLGSSNHNVTNNDYIYASPQQQQRPVFYPASVAGTPSGQAQPIPHPYPNNGSNNYNYPPQLASPQAVYDDPSYSGYNGGGNAHQQKDGQRTPYSADKQQKEMSLFSGMDSYSSWIEQQHDPVPPSPGGPLNNHRNHNNSTDLNQSHTSLSMTSPAPQRSIWASNADRVKSPSHLAPPTVYQPPSKVDDCDPVTGGMSRLSLLSAGSLQTQTNNHQKYRAPAGRTKSASSVQSGYSNLPGLVQASSESTTGASTMGSSWQEGSTRGRQYDADAANATILHSSLRSFLLDDDDDYNSSPSADKNVIAGPPGFGGNDMIKSPGGRPGNYKMGNANTRRNRNRNKLRQQKKVEQQHQHGRNNYHNNNARGNGSHHHNNKALKERNSITNNVQEHVPTLEPLFEKPPKGAGNNDSSSSLKRAVSQQGINSDGAPPSSEALRLLMSAAPPPRDGAASNSNLNNSTSLRQSVLDLESSFLHGSSGSLRLTSPMPSPRTPRNTVQAEPPILPQQLPAPTLPFDFSFSNYNNGNDNSTHSEEDEDLILQHILASDGHNGEGTGEDLDDQSPSSLGKKREWLLRMNKKIQEVPVGELDPSAVPISAIMNAWAKTKSAQGASMVETWLRRAQQEYSAGNHRIVPTTKMYTMAVDAWARSGERGAAANRAEALLHHMNSLYQSGEHDKLKPTTGIFNAVINAWARSREKIAPVRAEQILSWMENFRDLDIQPDKYTYNTVIHAWAKAGGTEAATKAQQLLSSMDKKFQEGNIMAKPDTITYNVVINAWAKSGGRGAALEAEKLLSKMHNLHEMGDSDVKPSVVTYGAVIDAYAKSGEKGSAARADTLLAHMIQLHQADPVKHADMLPNTYVFNTVINCWAKSKEHDAASKAEEMLVAMSRLHASGIPNLKPDAFTYTAVIDAWAKSGYRGAASRADQLLDKMEAKYLAGDADLKPNTFTYNAVINALAKSGEVGAAARAERVLQNMVNRYRTAGSDDVKPTTINFNTVLDAWAKSGGGRAAAERAEEILEWMDRLYKGGNPDVKPDTITFNAVLDAWARSGDRVAPHRAEQILDHMDDLYRAGNRGVKPDTYTYNTLINAWAKSGGRGAAARAEHVLSVMHKRYKDGDSDFKPNTRTHTSVIDAWAKSGEKGAARRAEQILNNMITHYEATGDSDVKPNVHTANAVCNACAFTKMDEDRAEAMQIAFRVFDWLSSQQDMAPDSYTFTILLSVCANLIPKEDSHTRYMHARAFFDSCREAGHVNDYVLRKLRQTVTEDEYLGLVDYRMDTSAASMPASWTRNAKINNHGKGRKGGGWNNNRRRK